MFAYLVKLFWSAFEYNAADIISRQHFQDNIYWQDKGQDEDLTQSVLYPKTIKADKL